MPNNLPIFFCVWCNIFIAPYRNTRGACVKAGGALRLPYPFSTLP